MVVIVIKVRFLVGRFPLVLLRRSHRSQSHKLHRSRIRRVRFVWIILMIVGRKFFFFFLLLFLGTLLTLLFFSSDGMENATISAQNNAKNSISRNVRVFRAKNKFANI